jgi:hypothetical protein
VKWRRWAWSDFMTVRPSTIVARFDGPILARKLPKSAINWDRKDAC